MGSGAKAPAAPAAGQYDTASYDDAKNKTAPLACWWFVRSWRLERAYLALRGDR